MKLLFLWLSFFALSSSFAQQKFHFPIYKDYPSFDWKSVEMSLDQKEVDKILKGSYRETYQYAFENFAPENGSFYDLFHAIDFDKDSIAEIVYNGWCGGEGKLLYIYKRQTDGNYLQILTEQQYLAKMDTEDGVIKYLYIFDKGCCAEYVWTEKVIELQHIKKNTTCKEVYYRQRYEDEIEPDILFEHPIFFEVINDDYNLRTAPNIYDKPDQISGESIQGNVIAKLSKGSIGKAIGKFIDKDEKEWWYVEILKQSKPKSTLYHYDSKHPNSYTGWVSAKFLRQL